LLICMLSGIGGARLFYVIQYAEQFRGRFWEVFRIDHGGLVFYGGFICTMIALVIYCRIARLRLMQVLSLLGPSLALGHMFGRIGCFLNGCCFGNPTLLPWGCTYPLDSDPGRCFPGQALHPVQLYESAGNLLIFAILQYTLPRSKGGQVAGLYMILYGTLRMLDEFCRGDYENHYLGIFTPAQLVCFFIIPLGIFIFIRSGKGPKDAAAATDH
ncbi:MAG: prolipoprotein diacylglyceryl transferase, partial [Victivallales bacterium]|nr:prolipoprotein diacylglyceryl transferase [Victivallales bacterium]